MDERAREEVLVRFGLTRCNDEVYYASGPLPLLGPEEVRFLVEVARSNPRERARICTHPSVNDPVHEMFILHAAGTYVRPHRHLGRSESFHLVEGRVEVLLFDEDGGLDRVVSLGDGAHPALPFYYRLGEARFHSLEILSEYVLFHEVTPGPFDRRFTEFPPWAPEDQDFEAVRAFQHALRGELERYRDRVPGERP